MMIPSFGTFSHKRQMVGGKLALELIDEMILIIILIRNVISFQSEEILDVELLCAVAYMPDRPMIVMGVIIDTIILVVVN